MGTEDVGRRHRSQPSLPSLEPSACPSSPFSPVLPSCEVETGSWADIQHHCSSLQPRPTRGGSLDPQPRASAGSTRSAHTSCCWLQLFPTELLTPSTRRCCIYLPSDPRGAHAVPNGSVPSLRVPWGHCSPQVRATPYTPSLPEGCRGREGSPGSSPRIYNADFEARHICSLAKGWVSHQAPLTPCSIIPSGRAICMVWTQTLGGDAGGSAPPHCQLVPPSSGAAQTCLESKMPPPVPSSESADGSEDGAELRLLLCRDPHSLDGSGMASRGSGGSGRSQVL